MLQGISRDIVPIEPPALARVGRRHGATGRSKDQAFQQGRGLGPRRRRASTRAVAENGVDLIPESPHDRLVLARIRDARPMHCHQ